MNFILISIVAVASLSVFPTSTYGSTDTDIEIPKALPLSSKKTDSERHVIESNPVELKSSDIVAGLKNDNIGEVWQETDHEVLIRNERGANKNTKDGGAGGGSGANGGKKGNKSRKDNNKKQNKQQQSQNTNAQTLAQSPPPPPSQHQPQLQQTPQSHMTTTHGNKVKSSRNGGDLKQGSCKSVNYQHSTL